MYKIKIESNNARFGGLIGLMVLNIALLNVINLAGQVWSRETYPRSSMNPCRRDYIFYIVSEGQINSYDKHDLSSKTCLRK
jgi:hypothetical protein